MSRAEPQRIDLPHQVCGAALITLLAALPGVMSLSTTRGFVLTKFAVGLPLAALAAIAAVWMFWSRPDPVSLKWRANPVALAGIGLLVAVAVSTAQAEAWQMALLGGFFRLEGALAWLAYLAVFFATRTWIRSGGSPHLLVDAMLIASIAPACYAIEQRFGLDFVSYTYGDPTRSAGTLGNPMFMGAYLAMCVPLALGRIGMPGTTTRSRAALLTVACLQLGGLLATGSRSPLLALVTALAFLACVRVYRHGNRSWLVGLSAMVIVLAGFLAFINLTEAGRVFARSTPAVSRLVYDVQGRDPATRSILGRLATWTAGEAALRAAPPWRLFTGFGPDVAHEHYYAFVPADKIRAEDFRNEQVFDRVHADLIDTAAALGLAGVLAIVALFALALEGVALRVFKCTARTARACLAAGAGGAIATWLLGESVGPSAMRWPLAGAGFVAGWLAAIAWVAWREAARPQRPAIGGEMLVAGAGAAILAFWVDAQVGLPVFVTRMAFFVLLAIATAPVQASNDSVSRVENLALGQLCFVVACLVAFCSFLPVFGADRDGSVPVTAPARLLPVLALLVLGRWVGKHPERQGNPAPPWRLVAMLVLLATVAVMRYRVSLPVTDRDWLLARSAAEAVLPMLLWVGPLFAAWSGWLASDVAARGRVARFVIVCMLGILITAWPVWRLIVANVTGAGSTLVDSRDADTRLAMLRATIDAAPWEWQYRYALVYEALPAASKEVLAGAPTAENYARYRQFVGMAEAVAREGLIEGSPDPWRPFLLGLSLQIRALSAIAPVDPDGSARASSEADALIGLSHRLFPVHPLILEHWIALKFDRGEFTAALALIDRMDTLIPDEPEPYLLRIAAGKRFGVRDQIEKGVVGARNHLRDKDLQRVLNVVN